MKVGKHKWVTIDISKIELNPEQAVLSCCDNTGRALSSGGGQCWGTSVSHGSICAVAGTGVAISS
ncbi:MAG: hypothetical protein PHP69_03830 [Candidatus Omnitrophica bacterium]|jgi:hypothetical protein|nr:hypothetical protein [Candidatus Omnitrophota bacterium]MDD5080585.1 hypothetical protein [Candidatus Omnitrophota bacterium]MDD5441479.1 hypothetical protein [Candidatus Omnitrophota bacterium]